MKNVTFSVIMISILLSLVYFQAGKVELKREIKSLKSTVDKLEIETRLDLSDNALKKLQTKMRRMELFHIPESGTKKVEKPIKKPEPKIEKKPEPKIEIEIKPVLDLDDDIPFIENKPHSHGDGKEHIHH